MPAFLQGTSLAAFCVNRTRLGSPVSWSLVWMPEYAGPDKNRHSGYWYVEKNREEADKKRKYDCDHPEQVFFVVMHVVTGQCSTVIPDILHCHLAYGKI